MLLKNEKIESLGGGIQIIVSDAHKFWTDTVLLAHFAAPKQNEKACDLGSGCGPIPLIWLREGVPASVTAVEIQENACSMFERSLALNGIKNKVEILCSDLRQLKGKVEFSAYDLVVCNPPYKADGAGIPSSLPSHRIARHEGSCTLQDIAACARSLLRFSGRFCMCQRPERLCDVIEAMRSNDIEPKRLRFVQQRKAKAPKLFLIEGKRGGKRGGMIVEPVLFIENDSGDFSEEMMAFYGQYKEAYL